MKKIFLAVFLLVTYVTNAQVYTKPNTTYGTGEYRRDIDSAFSYPTGCGIPTDSTFLRLGTGPTIRSLKKAYQYYDSCGHHSYIWDPSFRFWHVSDNSSGGSGPTDTAFLRTTLNHNTTVDAGTTNSLTFDNLDAGLFFKHIQLLTSSDNTYVIVIDTVSGKVYKIPAKKADTTGTSAIIASGGIAFAYYDILSDKIKFQTIPVGPWTKTGNIIRTTVNTDTLIDGTVAFPKAKANFGGGVQIDGATTGKNTVVLGTGDSTQADTTLLTYAASGNYTRKHVITSVNGSNPTFVTGANLNLTDWTNANISNGASQIFTQYVYRENAVGGSTRSAIGNFFNTPRVATGDSLGTSWGQIISFFNPNGKLVGLGGIHMSGTSDFSNILGSFGILDDNYTVNGGNSEHAAVHSNLAYGPNNWVINANGGARSRFPYIISDSIKAGKPIKSSGTPWLDVISKIDSLHRILTLDPTQFSTSGDTLHTLGSGGGSGTLTRIGPLDSLTAVLAGAQVSGSGIFMQTATTLYAGLESPLHKNTMDSLIAGTKKIKITAYKLGQPGYTTVTNSLAGDSLYLFTYRDSLDFHTTHNPDSSRTQYVNAHDTTSANALQSKYKADTGRSNVYAAIAAIVGGTTPGLQQVLNISNHANTPIRDSAAVHTDSIITRNEIAHGNLTVGDTAYSTPIVAVANGSSITAGNYGNPWYAQVLSNNFHWVLTNQSQVGTSVAPPLANSLYSRINLTPYVGASAWWFGDFGVNDTLTNLTTYQNYVVAIIDSLIVHGFIASHIIINSPPFSPNRQGDSIYMAPDSLAAALRGCVYVNILRPMRTAYYAGNTGLIYSDSLHPSTTGHNLIAQLDIHALYGVQRTANLVVNGSAKFQDDTVTRNQEVDGTTNPIGGFINSADNTTIPITSAKANAFGDYGGIRFRANVTTPDTGSNFHFRYVAQATRSNFDIVDSKATAEDTVIHIVGNNTNNDAIVFHGSTVNSGYRYNFNGNAYTAGNIKVTGGYSFGGDNSANSIKLPLFGSGGNYYGFGNDGSNNMYIGNVFGQMQFGGYAGGTTTFTGHSAFSANGTKLFVGTLTDNGNGDVLQVSGTAAATALNITGDATYRAKAYPLFWNGSNFIGTGIVATTFEVQNSNAFGPWSWGTGFGGSYVAKSQFNTSATRLSINAVDDAINNLLVNGRVKITDTCKLPNIVRKLLDSTNYKPMVVDGSGNIFKMDWATFGSGGATSVGTPSGSSTANGADITAGVLTLHPADGTNPGIVTTGAQTIAGVKTFSSAPIVPTQTALTNNTTVASTAYADAAVAANVTDKLLVSATGMAGIFGTSTEASIIGTPGTIYGTNTIAANYLTSKKTLRYRISGTYYTKAVTPGNLTIRIKIGGATIATAVVTNLVGGVNAASFTASGIIMVGTVSSGSASCWTDGILSYSTGTPLSAMDDADLNNATSPTTITTNASNPFDVTAQWATADSGNIITGLIVTLEAEN